MHTQMNLSSVYSHLPNILCIFHLWFPTSQQTLLLKVLTTLQLLDKLCFQSSDSIQYVEIPITDDGVPERTEYFLC